MAILGFCTEYLVSVFQHPFQGFFSGDRGKGFDQPLPSRIDTIGAVPATRSYSSVTASAIVEEAMV